jgi:hypothetical protein
MVKPLEIDRHCPFDLLLICQCISGYLAAFTGIPMAGDAG